MRSLRRLGVSVGVLATLLLAAAPVAGQFRGGGGRERGPDVPGSFTVGARGGYDLKGDAPVLGAFARSSVIGRLSLQATGDLTFLDGFTERQAGADLLVALGPGLHLGGGPVWRRSVYGTTPQDPGVVATRSGYSLVAIVGGAPSAGRTITGLEFRYVVVDELRSQVLALQVGLSLFQW